MLKINNFKVCEKGKPVNSYDISDSKMITIYLDITAPIYWWKELEYDKVSTVISFETMNEKIFTLEDFSYEHLFNGPYYSECIGSARDEENDTYFHKVWATPLELLNFTIEMLNNYRRKYNDSNDKEDWWQMVQLIPVSYNQRRKIMIKHEDLVGMYKTWLCRELDEWQIFCNWISESFSDVQYN